MVVTKAALRKHSHHTLMLAKGTKAERDHVFRTAPASLDALLHGIANGMVQNQIGIPSQHRSKAKVDALIRYARARPEERKKLLRGNKAQRGAGLLSSLLGPVLGIAAQVLGA